MTPSTVGQVSTKFMGGDGHDWIYGNEFGDRLWGDGGNDRMYGGDGNDEMYGGNDNGLYVWRGRKRYSERRMGQ